jgi:D-amino-acid oxidase
LHIAVIGGGTIGLSTASRLLEAGHQVTVIARALTPETTSDVAAAFWSPGAMARGPRERAWALESLPAFRGLASIPESGIALVEQHALTDISAPLPDLAEAGPARPVPAGRFPPPWSGWSITAPRIDVPVYMPWLLEHVRSLGGEVRREAVDSIEALPAEYEAVVNCTGLGSATLLRDSAMFPIRGQVILVRRPTGLPDDVIHAEAGDVVTYIVPRSADVLLGGTYQYGESSMEVDAAIATAIMERCSAFYPQLRGAEVLRHRVGLRPGRESVRLEAERLADGRFLVHNYGHGSIGHTLSWGCAAEVVQLLTGN